MRDLHSTIGVKLLLPPTPVNNDGAATPANGFDVSGFGSAELIVSIGNSGDSLSASRAMKVVIEDSDDDANYAPVAADDLLIGSDGVATPPAGDGVVATIDAANEDNIKVRAGYIGVKRFARARVDFIGTHSNGTPISILAIGGHPNLIPVTDQ